MRIRLFLTHMWNRMSSPLNSDAHAMNGIHLLDSAHLFLLSWAVLFTVIHIVSLAKKLPGIWRTRHLRKVWGIRNGDYVTVVCSELENATERQHVEPREFIYNLKYGDVDAYFEVIVTLLRLFPRIKLRILSAGEAENVRIDTTDHLVLIGGPDYNSITARVLEKQMTRYYYKSPYVKERSSRYPDEIVIHDAVKRTDFCELTDEKDYGYFERIRNPNNPRTNIILIGGCHTVGVTGAVKAFSMAGSERGEIPTIVLENAKIVAKSAASEASFSVLLRVDRIGQTINVPIVKIEDIAIGGPQTPPDAERRQSNVE